MRGMDLSGLEAEATARLDPSAAAYVNRGAAHDDTREANLEAWRRLRLRPHVVRDVAAVETTAQILGVEVAAPVLVAPTAMHHLVSPDAERSAARAAAAAGTVMVVSMASSIPLGEIAAAAPDAPRFAQMYVFRDRARTARWPKQRATPARARSSRRSTARPCPTRRHAARSRRTSEASSTTSTRR